MYSFGLYSLCFLLIHIPLEHLYCICGWTVVWLNTLILLFWLFNYLMKQAGCLHIRLFYEEKFAGNCKGLPSRRKGLFRSSWYAFFCKLCEAIIFLMGFSTSFLLFFVKNILFTTCKKCFFLQQLMHLVAFFSSGGQFFGIYS